MSHVLLIDGNSIAHANHNANKLTVGDMQVQAIFGFLKSLRSMLNQHVAGTRPIVLWDGKADFRFAIYPEYKGNREAKDAKQVAHKEAFRKQTPLLEKALTYLGVMQIRSPRLEADDLAAHMVATTLVGRQVTLISGDKDWIQLVNQDVCWYDPIRDRSVSHTDFFEKTGYKTPKAFAEGKALMGDTSDNVPGVGGIGEKGAPLLLAQYGSMTELFRMVDEKKKMKLGAAVMRLTTPEGRALFERNMKLMDLSQARRLEPGEAIINRGHPSQENFERLCKALMFASILRELPQFMRSFGITGPVTPD